MVLIINNVFEIVMSDLRKKSRDTCVCYCVCYCVYVTKYLKISDDFSKLEVMSFQASKLSIRGNNRNSSINSHAQKLVF